MELTQIQDLLSDAMEMAQGEELAVGIEPEMVDAVASILSNWVTTQVSEDESDPPDPDLFVSLVSSAAACAYLAGRLEAMQDNVASAGQSITYDVEPTHPEAQHVTINLNFR